MKRARKITATYLTRLMMTLVALAGLVLPGIISTDPPAASAADPITLTGTITYPNWDGLVSFAKYFRLELWLGDSNHNPQFATAVQTDNSNGTFQISTATLPDPSTQGGVSLRLYSSCEHGSDEVKVLDDRYNNSGQKYWFESGLYPYTQGSQTPYDIGTWDIALEFRSAGLWAKDGLHQSYEKAHTTGFNNSSKVMSMTAVWPHPYWLWPWSTGSWYKYDSNFIDMPPGDVNEIYLDRSFDPLSQGANKERFFNTSIHETGHYVMFKLYDGTMPLTVTQYSIQLMSMEGAHSYWETSSPEFAWMEGWAEFWALAVRFTPADHPWQEDLTYGDTDVDGYGQAVEGYVTAALWDLLDSNADTNLGYTFDKAAYSFALADIWNRVAGGGTTQTKFADFWTKWQTDLPPTVENARRSVYQSTMAVPFPPATPIPFIAAEAAVAPVVTSANIAAIDVRLARTKDSRDSTDAKMPDGLKRYAIKIGPSVNNAVIMGIEGVETANFYQPDLDTVEPDGSLVYVADTKLSTGPWPPSTLGRIRIRLTGSKNNSSNMNVFLKSAIIKGTGEDIGSTTPMPLTFRRGDANNNGSVSIVDALFIAQYIAGLRGLGFTTAAVNPINAASVNWDDRLTGDQITMEDASYIAQMLAGLRTEYYEDANTTSIAVSSGSAAPGYTTQIPVEVHNVTDRNGLTTYQLKITFNPLVMKVNSISGGDSPFTNFSSIQIDNTLGYAFITQWITQDPGVTGNQRIAVLNVEPTGVSGNSTTINVAGLGTTSDMWDSKGIRISQNNPVTVSPGLFTVL